MDLCGYFPYGVLLLLLLLLLPSLGPIDNSTWYVRKAVSQFISLSTRFNLFIQKFYFPHLSLGTFNIHRSMPYIQLTN